MITLTPITTPEKLEEYYRFRYRIYNESRLKGFVEETEGMDKDAYDERAWHFGWYVDGQLAGCIRFIEADESKAPLPMFSYLPEGAARKAVQDYLAGRKAKGQRTIEASRFCLAPEHRGLRNARDLVLAMVMTMQPLGFEHGLFDCNPTHKKLYRILGFDVLPNAMRFEVPYLAVPLTTMTYDYAELITRNEELLARMGFTQGRGMNKAA